ncbi:MULTISPECIES: hypothetical protein [Chryseobacterium]|uniref:hypothetical protein n=1 Tax=Chryseobacterium TaxID=59732 RepID=UPI001294E283|nr:MULTISPECIES: hypothetical protein [Chryseobacterium]MDR6923471.1 hypothetical protein [Chryseobacterium sp. 2987]
MKLYIKTILFSAIVASASSFAQIKSNNVISNTIPGQSAFLDASAPLFNGSVGNGKGIVFPRTNLTTFVFTTQTTNAGVFPTAYDGMIVYNSATGNTPSSGSGVGGQAVTPGYYYFSNPTGGAANSYATSTGRWLPIAGDPKVNITTAETLTNTSIAASPVYARKGTFSANGTSTAPTFPSGAIVIPSTGSLYRITIFQAGTNNVYANSVYSYDKTTGNFVTGAPSMSVVYPSGSYDYIVEYTK